jgi:hypothetical protein
MTKPLTAAQLQSRLKRAERYPFLHVSGKRLDAIRAACPDENTRRAFDDYLADRAVGAVCLFTLPIIAAGYTAGLLQPLSKASLARTFLNTPFMGWAAVNAVFGGVAWSSNKPGGFSKSLRAALIEDEAERRAGTKLRLPLSDRLRGFFSRRISEYRASTASKELFERALATMAEPVGAQLRHARKLARGRAVTTSLATGLGVGTLTLNPVLGVAAAAAAHAAVMEMALLPCHRAALDSFGAAMGKARLQADAEASNFESEIGKAVSRREAAKPRPQGQQPGSGAGPSKP